MCIGGELMSIFEEDILYLAELEVLNKLAGKKILITGSTGMIASYMIKVLLKYNEMHKSNKCKIIAVCRNLKKVKEVFGEDFASKDIEFVYGDVCELTEIKSEIDIIIHAASNTAPEIYKSNPVDTYLANTVGTNRMLEIALKKKTECFLYLSSASVYGNVTSNILREDNVGIIAFYDHKNSYSESKRMGENMCMSYYAQYGLPIKIVRPFHMYGPGMSKINGNMFAEFISKIENNQNIILKSRGTKFRNFTYLRDSIFQMFYVLCLGKEGEIYNIGNTDATSTVKDFAQSMLDSVPERKLIIEYHLGEQVIPSNSNDMIPGLSKIESLMSKEENVFLGIKDGIERWMLYERERSCK